MKSKFFRPGIIWLGVWLAIFFAMMIIGSWQNDLYWRGTLARFSSQELATINKVLPYATAYLAKQQPDLLQDLVDVDLGPYALVITDKAGKIKYVPHFLASEKNDANLLKGKNFFYFFSNPNSVRALSGPFIDGGAAEPPKDAADALGRIYLIAKEPHTFKETLSLAYGKILSPAQSVFAFTLLSYIMVLVGFAGICAISARFQAHFQKVQEDHYEAELEARELRIQVLESKTNSANLWLQLLDRSHEDTQIRLNKAQDTIAKLESAIEYESNINEELREGLMKAVADRDEAVQTMQAIERDREQIDKELRELEVLKEVEEMNRPEASREKTRRPKEFLWLNMVYKNLYFSRRALQNIIDLQNSTDIFPSLPDALATLNNCSVEALGNAGTFPSRSVVKYSQQLTHHSGDFWEYRFSKDGRIFFGVSRSKTWNIDTILLKRKFTENRYKYEKYLEQTLGKDNNDLK